MSMVGPQENIFDFNHIDTALSKGTCDMLKNLYTYYHKNHYSYKKLCHLYQRKKSDLQRHWQSCDNFSSC